MLLWLIIWWMCLCLCFCSSDMFLSISSEIKQSAAVNHSSFPAQRSNPSHLCTPSLRWVSKWTLNAFSSASPFKSSCGGIRDAIRGKTAGRRVNQIRGAAISEHKAIRRIYFDGEIVQRNSLRGLCDVEAAMDTFSHSLVENCCCTRWFVLMLVAQMSLRSLTLRNSWLRLRRST